ncbi:MAG: chemotaxis response regulator protein-glutamate methylesterase, partial [Proteobacteria bacterium]|nr:chemotaxis response regulator protein-glutamate methylesterase [Pseudomonadota bacterium]
LAEMAKLGLQAKVIVFTSQSGDGAAGTLAALKLGALDFVVKPSGVSSLEGGVDAIRQQLLPKILQFQKREGLGGNTAKPINTSSTGNWSTEKTPASPNSSSNQGKFRRVDLSIFAPKLIVIGSSTGGPNALELIFTEFKGRTLNIPIVIAQHMPALFTKQMADRLSSVSGLPCQEAVNGESLQAGRVYIAPGDFHTTLGKRGYETVLTNDQGPKRNSVRPAVDSLFESAATVFKNQVLAVVLTGMGEDGALGCCAIKEAGGGVLIQDQESCVVWGMPGAVHERGAFDKVAPLKECAQFLANLVSKK